MAVPSVASPRLTGLRGEAGQFAFLTRHFFGRLFRNEVVDFEDQMKERLIATLAVLAVIIFWSSELLLFKYHFIPDANLSWQEKTYITALVMIIFGIVTLLEWDVLFPDRQDFLNLMPLPLRLRTIFLGKLASFLLFIGLFSAAMNCGAAVLFSLYLAQWRAGGDLVFAARYAASHLLAETAACFFVFFGCVFLQFVLMAVLPYGWYRRVSLVFRGALLAVLFFLLLAFLIEPGVLDKSFKSMDALKAASDPFLLRFPPFWFVGLYETLLGTKDLVFAAGARTAVWGVWLSLAGFGAASALSYYRHVRRTLESPRTRPAFRQAREAAAGLFARLALRSPEERAVFGFFSRTLRGNTKHRITLTYYLAIAAAVILLSVVSNKSGFRGLSPERGMLLAQPLVLALVVLAAIRTLVNVPASPRANWVFAVTDTGRTGRYASATRKAVFFRWLVPLAGLVFVVHWILWGPGPALGHTLFVLVISGLGVEAFFYHFRKVPFACTHVPGKFKFHVWGIPIAFAVLLFFSAATAVERALLKKPSGFAVFLAAAAAVWGLSWLGQRRFYRTASLVFEDEPEEAMVTLPSGS